MKPARKIRRPVLAGHARYRWDEVRRQHQIVFPEGLLVLNPSGAAIARRCDGRPTAELIAAVESEFGSGPIEADVWEFLERLDQRGLLRDADDA